MNPKVAEVQQVESLVHKNLLRFRRFAVVSKLEGCEGWKWGHDMM